MSENSENSSKSVGVWSQIIAISLVILTCMVGYNFYAQAQDEACRKLSMEPVLLVRVTGYRWSFSKGCEIQIFSNYEIEPEWIEERLFKVVYTRADD